MATHYCYLVSAGGFVKIGHTKDLSRRMDEINTHCPLPTNLLVKFIYETEFAARQMEKHLHQRMRRHRVKGEWFKKAPVLKYLSEEGKKVEGF